MGDDNVANVVCGIVWQLMSWLENEHARIKHQQLFLAELTAICKCGLAD